MNTNEFLKNTFLFKGLDKSKAEVLIKTLRDPPLTFFDKNQTVFPSSAGRDYMGFIVSGQCTVLSEKDGTPVILNTLGESAPFGVLNLFGDNEQFPTKIVAKKKSTVLFLSKAQIRELFDLSSEVSMNFILFLSDRIRFLNGKISEFVKNTATQKLAKYILDVYPVEKPFSLNCKATSEKLGIGRTSLYRALNDLLLARAIEKIENKFIIQDKNVLERMSK